LAALRKAMARRERCEELIHHSDRLATTSDALRL